MIDPGSIERRIDGEPAVQEDHHRGTLGSGVGRLEQPVRAGALAELESDDLAMRIFGIVFGRSLAAGTGMSSSAALRGCTGLGVTAIIDPAISPKTSAFSAILGEPHVRLPRGVRLGVP